MVSLSLETTRVIKRKQGMNVADQRKSEIADSIERIKDALWDGINLESLNKAKAIMLQLASRKDLFRWTDFPVPNDEEIYRTFLVHQEEGGAYSLYVNSSLPGQLSPPHDHGGSWAIVAAVEGEELHRVYKQTNSETSSNKSPITLAGEILVRPGNAISLLPDGIHSIHAESDAPLLHLHLYGMGFEYQGERSEYDLEAGEVKRFKLEDIGVVEDAR